jgi:Glycosyltransferase 61
MKGKGAIALLSLLFLLLLFVASCASLEAPQRKRRDEARNSLPSRKAHFERLARAYSNRASHQSSPLDSVPFVKHASVIHRANAVVIESGQDEFKVHLGSFAIRAPHFVDDDDRLWWLSHTTAPTAYQRIARMRESAVDDPIFPLVQEHGGYGDWLLYHGTKFSVGRVVLRRNATFHVDDVNRPYDCGQNSEPHKLYASGERHRYDNNVRHARRAVFAFIPPTRTIQHWIDSALPKIALTNLAGQWFRESSTMTTTGDMVAFQRIDEVNFPFVYKLWEHVGVPRENVESNLKRPVFADEQLFFCNAPGHHPLLWQHGQKMLGVRASRVPMAERHKVVLMSRSHPDAGHASNGGRVNLGETAMIERLERLFESTPFYIDVFNHNKFADVPALVDYFADCRVIVGGHGGALTNFIYAPPMTAVIEIMPVVGAREVPSVGHGAAAYYIQTALANQRYWLVLARAIDSRRGDFHVNLDHVVKAFEQALHLKPAN